MRAVRPKVAAAATSRSGAQLCKGLSVIVAAKAAGYIDDSADVARIAGRQRQRPPAAGRIADDHDPGPLDGLVGGHERDGGGDRVGSPVAGGDEIGVLAPVLVLEVGATGLPVSGPLGQEHGIAMVEQPSGHDRIVRRGHARTKVRILLRGVIDHGEAKRPGAWRPIEPGVHGDAGRREGDRQLLGDCPRRAIDIWATDAH